MSLVLPFSEACERNKDPILESLAPYLSEATKVLEIGSGTGQHAVHFARAYPDLSWQPTDQAQYLDGIRAQIKTHGSANIAEPSVLDVTQQPWQTNLPNYDLVYTDNTLHIMPWTAVEAFFQGLPAVCRHGTHLFVYGPFIFNGKHTSQSNQAFDASLQARGTGSGIREFTALTRLAQGNGFKFLEKHTMPANNFSLVWRYLAD